MCVWYGLTCLRIVFSGGSYERGNESSGFVRDGEFLSKWKILAYPERICSLVQIIF
jgi:hypothetical protein